MCLCPHPFASPCSNPPPLLAPQCDALLPPPPSTPMLGLAPEAHPYTSLYIIHVLCVHVCPCELHESLRSLALPECQDIDTVWCCAALPVLLRLRHPDVPVPRPAPCQVWKVSTMGSCFGHSAHFCFYLPCCQVLTPPLWCIHANELPDLMLSVCVIIPECSRPQTANRLILDKYKKQPSTLVYIVSGSIHACCFLSASRNPTQPRRWD